ncbi:Ldh family oxidoreductase [Microbacterium resistens]|uniref:Ldh family oxidoreductase n=1 Tax=Microbacterium resistens TaxID=156977 RepID=UPI000831FAF1|nr:Ldh family oxidoreductase [Microbacterium resistens]
MGRESAGRVVSAGLVFAPEDLIARATRMLVAAGADERSAHLVADGLVEADARGLPSHGLLLLPMYLDRIRSGSVDPAARNRILADLGALLTVDAGNGLGQASAQDAMDLAIARAREHGIAAVACRNAFHFGGAYRYAAMAADAGMIGVAAANTRPLMPAPGGARAVVGNNPIAVAVPRTDRDPIVVDLALSEAAMGKIRLAASEGRPIPDTWATDAEGRPTTDPAAAIAGFLLPAGGAKGFALALIVDVLTGVLSGGGFGAGVRGLYADATMPYNSSTFFLALDASTLDPGFADRAAELAAQVQAAPMTSSETAARIPGERSAQNRRRSMREGIRLPGSVVEQIEQWEQQLGLRGREEVTR